MSKNMSKKMIKKIIQFISNDGDYPNLCSGTLVICIKECVEDFNSCAEKNHINCKEYHLKNVLMSGGTCGFRNDYAEDYCYQGEWDVNEYNLPDELKPFKKEIKKVVNENVPLGCCGGCL